MHCLLGYNENMKKLSISNPKNNKFTFFSQHDINDYITSNNKKWSHKNHCFDSFSLSSNDSENSCFTCNESSISNYIDDSISKRSNLWMKNVGNKNKNLGYSDITVISSRETIKSNEASQKIKLVTEKISNAIKNISLQLSNFIIPQEEDDIVGLNRKAYEFCNRFSRNYLYQIGLQLNDISRNKNYCLPYSKWKDASYQNKYIYVFQALLQAFLMFQRHMRIVWGLDKTVEKLFTLTNLTLEILKFKENDEPLESCNLKLQCDNLIVQLDQIKNDRQKWICDQKKTYEKNSITSNKNIRTKEEKNKAEDKLSMYKKSISIKTNRKSADQGSYIQKGYIKRPNSEMQIKKPISTRRKCYSADYNKRKDFVHTIDINEQPNPLEKIKKDNMMKPENLRENTSGSVDRLEEASVSNEDCLANASHISTPHFSSINPTKSSQHKNAHRQNIQVISVTFDDSKKNNSFSPKTIEKSDVKRKESEENAKTDQINNLYKSFIQTNKPNDVKLEDDYEGIQFDEMNMTEAMVDMQMDALLKQMIEMELTDCFDTRNIK